MKNYYRAIGVVVVSAVLLASTACDGPPPKPAGMTPQTLQERLVTEVNAVEGPDGDDRAAVTVAQVRKSANQLHGRLSDGKDLNYTDISTPSSAHLGSREPCAAPERGRSEGHLCHQPPVGNAASATAPPSVDNSEGDQQTTGPRETGDRFNGDRSKWPTPSPPRRRLVRQRSIALATLHCALACARLFAT